MYGACTKIPIESKLFSIFAEPDIPVLSDEQALINFMMENISHTYQEITACEQGDFDFASNTKDMMNTTETNKFFPEFQIENNYSSDTLAFIHCGKWDTIDELQDESDISFVIVTDDNLDNTILESNIPILTVPSHTNNDKELTANMIDKTKIILNKGQLYVDSSIILPHKYYNLIVHLKTGSVQFVFIDSNLLLQSADRNHMDQMLRWLESILSQNNYPHIFIIGYHPLFDYLENELISPFHTTKLLDVLKNFDLNYYYLCHGMECSRYIHFNGISIYKNLSINIMALSEPMKVESSENNNTIEKNCRNIYGQIIGILDINNLELTWNKYILEP